jgi:hypothetical protein
MPGRRQEVEEDSDHRVNRDQLNPLEPIGPAIARHHRADQHGQEQRSDFRAAEGEFQRLRRDEVTEQDERWRWIQMDDNWSLQNLLVDLFRRPRDWRG